MRFTSVVIAVVFALQINTSLAVLSVINPLLAPVLNNPVLNSIFPFKKTLEEALNGLLPLLGCDCGGVSPYFQDSVAAYNVYQSYTKGSKDYDNCCRADQFPELFAGLSCLAYCVQNKAAFEVGQPVCRLLEAVSKLVCDPANPGPGCELQKMLDVILGPVGGLLGASIVNLLEPLEKLDGCLISGAAEYHSRAIYNVSDSRNYGNAVDPVGAVGGVALGGLFGIFRCIGLTSVMAKNAWIDGSQRIVDHCNENIKNGYWDRPFLKEKSDSTSQLQGSSDN
ncbi:hypothetical protein Bhyg_02778 [Pseudolycoriella hygida]|uniref:Uncharacterized protein n=1 Tax=Pseudolycoriella hygida TaxID=35572 RepID=A0A9Q0S8Q2_9DIPT|nr:hypothetical protein Bhyg_02778 [Pseudolycoriella hygida]